MRSEISAFGFTTDRGRVARKHRATRAFSSLFFPSFFRAQTPHKKKHTHTLHRQRETGTGPTDGRSLLSVFHYFCFLCHTGSSSSSSMIQCTLTQVVRDFFFFRRKPHKINNKPRLLYFLYRLSSPCFTHDYCTHGSQSIQESQPGDNM